MKSLIRCLSLFAAMPTLAQEYEGDTSMPRGTLSFAVTEVLTQPAQPPPTGVPELGVDEVLSLVARAFSGKQWGLLGVLALVGLVLLLLKVGGRWMPLLGTPRGAVVLTLVGGTGTLLAVALGAGQPLTLGLVLSCLMTAASASGLWSWGQSALKRPAVAVICTPTEIANGTCRPS